GVPLVVHAQASSASDSATTPAGQTPTQAPQPVQRAASIQAAPRPPGGTRIASSGQTSRQLAQTTPLAGRQPSPTFARRLQGRACPLSSAQVVQAAAHAPQNVHSPLPADGSKRGRPSAARRRTRSGQ